MDMGTFKALSAVEKRGHRAKELPRISRILTTDSQVDHECTEAKQAQNVAGNSKPAGMTSTLSSGVNCRATRSRRGSSQQVLYTRLLPCTALKTLRLIHSLIAILSGGASLTRFPENGEL